MTTQKKARGFALVPKDKLREITSAGGKAAHAKGTAHRFTSETGRIAGLKGVQFRLKAQVSSGPKFLSPEEDKALKARAMKSGTRG